MKKIFLKLFLIFVLLNIVLGFNTNEFQNISNPIDTLKIINVSKESDILKDLKKDTAKFHKDLEEAISEFND